MDWTCFCFRVSLSAEHLDSFPSAGYKLDLQERESGSWRADLGPDTNLFIRCSDKLKHTSITPTKLDIQIRREIHRNISMKLLFWAVLT